MAKKTFVRDNVPLSRFGVLVAQLESIVSSASQQSPDPLLCFDLLSDLITAIEEEPKESILLWQRKCEDALYSLVTLGARRPVRHLASVAMAMIISKGDSISIYSRASSLQGFLSDVRRSEPQKFAGTAQCLGTLYGYFGKKFNSGLLETTTITTKLMKFNEEYVRQQALLMLQNALEGAGGNAIASAYSEAYRLITRIGIGDKSFVVRIAAARCLQAFANIGGPGLGVGELDSLSSYCVKGLEDPVSSVRDAFAEALGSLLALGMNPDAQVQPRGKGPFPPAKKLEGGLNKHLTLPFTKASGSRSKDVRIGLALSWVSFLQATHLKYSHPDTELQKYALHVMEMLRGYTSVDAHALACVLYVLRVGVIDQMMEPTQRSFLVFLGKQLQSPDASSSMKIAALRTLSYTLKTLGEVPTEFKEVFDDTVVAALFHSSQLVRLEAALTLRALAEVDPTCVGGLISYGVTTLSALRENVSFEKGSNLQVALDSLHGQAAVLAALVAVSPQLPLGYPTRLPKSVLQVSKKMLTEISRNPTAATVEQEAGWSLLSSLLNSMPLEELQDQIFDILSLWADPFSGNLEDFIKQCTDLTSTVSVWSAAMGALAAFVRRFVASDAVNDGILLQPVMVYLSRGLSCVSLLAGKELANIKTAIDTFIIRILIAYQTLPDPTAYKTEHHQIIQLCTTPYRSASGCEESSCLRFLLDKRDAWLGPWIPGRDWFEDELRSFQGGKDGLMPCVWETEHSSFPLPETVNKTLVNQMLLCFGVMFASQDNDGMLALLATIEQCLKSGKKQIWRSASVTNICVGLLAGLKSLLASRPQPLSLEILNAAQSIFQSILAEGDICSSQRRAACEGLGLLARLGNDLFTARMTRSLLADLNGITDSYYAGSIALALGCIHRSAGGMALSSLVPATVNSISLLAKTSILGLQIWALHGLLLTIEAAGLSFVSHVQATLSLAMDILLSEESGWIDLPQGVGRLINALVAVLGPELAPGSILFSRCKSVVAEISSWQETATLLESVRFTQQLVLFAPQAVSVHSHVHNLLSTLSSREPTLRHLAVSTLRHLIEKDPVSVIDEQIEDNLFQMLDEETDSEIGNLLRSTMLRLLYATCPSCPSRWILICRNMVLASSTRRITETENASEHDSSNSVPGTSVNFGNDDENMVSSSEGIAHANRNKDRHLRYRTRVFAAECLSFLPEAVGVNPAHFDLCLARKVNADRPRPGNWLVLHLQELISLAYQLSTIQFESMQPIGVGLLSTIVDKFEVIADPELPGHLLLEQYQAQLVSAVRTALDASSGPVLLESGLHLATKIMTSGIISGDQAAVKRIFSLISRPLNDFKDLYYPSFAEWVTCKIKIRLLAAHASLKCYTYTFLRRHHCDVPDEYQALLPLFSKSSSVLGKYWVEVLKNYSSICLCLNIKRNWSTFLDGIESHVVSAKLQPCLEEAWPVILQALALDAVPVNLDSNGHSSGSLISRFSMVELQPEDYKFLWGFSWLVLFQGQHPKFKTQVIPLGSIKAKYGGDSTIEEINVAGLKLYEIVLPVFQSLCGESFFAAGFLTMSVCQELMKVFLYSIYLDASWNSLAVSILLQIVENCSKDFLKMEDFIYLTVELCLGILLNIFQSTNAVLPADANCEDLMTSLFRVVQTLMRRSEFKMNFMSVPLAFLLTGYKCVSQVSTESCLLKVLEFVKGANLLFHKFTMDTSDDVKDANFHIRFSFSACVDVITDLTEDCIKSIHRLENKRSDSHKLLQLKLGFCLEQNVALAKLAYETECLEDKRDGNHISFSVFKKCSNHMRIVLTDSNLEVQAVGFQVVKSLVQRSSNVDDSSFLIFFVGELLGDLFTVIQRIMKKPLTKESTNIVTECLRVLMLLQTLSKVGQCQGSFMNLLVVAILMVFSVTSDGQSQEIHEIQSTAVRIVSHLAQIPSSAAHFKDILLSLPITQRQQLQGVIRASMGQDNNEKKVKPAMPTLDFKLPVPAQKTTVEAIPAPRPIEVGEVASKTLNPDNDSGEESEEEDDDWDTFQSFPASTNSGGGSEPKPQSVAELTAMVENSSSSEIEPNETCNVENNAGGEQFSSAVNDLNISNPNELEKSDSGQEISSVNVDIAERTLEELRMEDSEQLKESPVCHHSDCHVLSIDAEGSAVVNIVDDQDHQTQSPDSDASSSLPATELFSDHKIAGEADDNSTKEEQLKSAAGKPLEKGHLNSDAGKYTKVFEDGKSKKEEHLESDDDKSLKQENLDSDDRKYTKEEHHESDDGKSTKEDELEADDGKSPKEDQMVANDGKSTKGEFDDGKSTKEEHLDSEDGKSENKDQPESDDNKSSKEDQSKSNVTKFSKEEQLESDNVESPKEEHLRSDDDATMETMVDTTSD